MDFNGMDFIKVGLVKTQDPGTQMVIMFSIHSIHSWYEKVWTVCTHLERWNHGVDGRNPAPVDRWFIRWLFLGFQHVSTILRSCRISQPSTVSFMDFNIGRIWASPKGVDLIDSKGVFHPSKCGHLNNTNWEMNQRENLWTSRVAFDQPEIGACVCIYIYIHTYIHVYAHT